MREKRLWDIYDQLKGLGLLRESLVPANSVGVEFFMHYILRGHCQGFLFILLYVLRVEKFAGKFERFRCISMVVG